MKSLILCFLGIFALVSIFGCAGSDDQQQPNVPTVGTSPSINATGVGGVVGSAKVDSFNGGSCGYNACDPDREDNTIAPDQTQLIWINQSSINSCGSSNFYYRVFDGNTQVIGLTSLGSSVTSCGDYFGYLWTAPSASLFKTSHSANLVLYCGNGLTIVSGDSFRLVDNGSCVK